MHIFSPFCPMSIDENITKDSCLWTEKAAILPDITYFWCGAASVWGLKCWITFDCPSPIVSAKSWLLSYGQLLTCTCSPAEPPAGRSGGIRAAQEDKISAQPWRKCLVGCSPPRQPSPAMEQ